MKSQRIRPSELLKLRKKTGLSYWDLVGNPLPTFDNGSDDVEALSPHPYTAKNIQLLRPFERFYTGADGKEQTVDQLAGLGQNLSYPSQQVVDANNASWYMSGGTGVPTGTTNAPEDLGADYVVNTPDINVIGTAPKMSHSEIVGGKPTVKPLETTYPEFDILLGGRQLFTDFAGQFAKNTSNMINSAAEVGVSDGPKRSFFRKVWDWFHDIPWSDRTNVQLRLLTIADDDPLNVMRYGTPRRFPEMPNEIIGEIEPSKRVGYWANEQLRRLLNFGIDPDKPIFVNGSWTTPRQAVLDATGKPIYIANGLPSKDAAGLHYFETGNSFIDKPYLYGSRRASPRTIQLHEVAGHGTENIIGATRATNIFNGSPMELYLSLVNRLSRAGRFKNMHSKNADELRSTMIEVANKAYDDIAGKGANISDPKIISLFEQYIDGLSDSQFLRLLLRNAYGLDYVNAINNLLATNPSEANYIISLMKEGLKKWPVVAAPVAAGATTAATVASSQLQLPEGLDHGADNHLYFAGELPEVVVRGSRKVAEDAIDAKLRKQLEYDQLNRLAWNIMLSRSLLPPKPIKVRIEPEEEWQPIEVYKHGKPSKRLYNRIAAWEGSDYAGQNAKLGGDAVGKFYEWTRNAVGDDIWNRLNQQQREALTSYRYNIKYDSFLPTINALHKWYNNPTSENLKAVRDSMNVGMDRKGYSGLRKRRLAEQAWFMEGIPYTNPDRIVILPDATRVAKPIMQVSRLRTPFKTGGDVIIPAEDDYTLNPVEIPFRPSAQLPDLIDVYNHMFGTGLPTMNDGKDSGIHIKPSKRGTFTSAAKRHGMGVQEFANKVLSAPKGRYSSSMRKKANFARNAKSFKH